MQQMKYAYICTGVMLSLTGGVMAEAATVQNPSIEASALGLPRLVPDYDRDGKIDVADRVRAADGKSIFRFWINDDDDNDSEDTSRFAPGKGAINEKTTNIPGSGTNHTAGRVNGLVDLEDFTPLMIDLSEVFPRDMPLEVRKTVKWKMKSSCVAVVWTDLRPSTAGDYRFLEQKGFGPELNEQSYKATAISLKTPTQIPDAMMEHIISNDYCGICLMEGIGPGTDLEITGELTDGQSLVKGKLELRIDGVEKMYRWMDLRACRAEQAAKVEGSNELKEPDNGPDSDCNGIPRGDRHFLFVHGYNVDARQARGWGATIFKRFWQSGNNDRFTVVDWHGSYGKGTDGCDSLEYYAAVHSAFRSAKYFQQAAARLDGKKWIVAHSLGNMLAAAAIQDWKLEYEKFYLVNAAVTVQAFDAKAERYIPMLDPRWDNVQPEYCSYGWHELFDANDFRSTLNWKGRFAAVTNAVNCYSYTDDVVMDLERKSWLYRFDDWESVGSIWGILERTKGTRQIERPDRRFTCTTISREAGWGVNEFYKNFKEVIPGEINDCSPEQMKEIPLFHPFDHEPEKLMSIKSFPLTRDDWDGYQYDLRAVLLADAIPVVSHAAGAHNNKIFSGNIRLADQRAKNWPRIDGSWMHSDIKNVAYYFEKDFYDKLVKGENK